MGRHFSRAGFRAVVDLFLELILLTPGERCSIRQNGRIPNNLAGTNIGFDGWQSVQESLRKFKPTVYVDGQALSPGLPSASLASTRGDHDCARPCHRTVDAGATVDFNEWSMHAAHRPSAGDLLNKLEAIRVLCRNHCAQRYMAHDALNGILQAVMKMDDAEGFHRARRQVRPYLQRSRTKT